MNTQEKSFKRFLIVWLGQFISAVGSGLTAFALGVYVFQNTHSAISYSLIILFAFLPSFILLPFGGVLADRFNRKKMMVCGDAGAVTGLLFILLMMIMGNIQTWHIYVGVAMSSVFVAVQIPAYKAAVTDLVTERRYSQASGLIQLAASAQYLISPIIAGLLLSVFDIKLILIIDIMTFLIAVTAVLVINSQVTVSQAREYSGFFRDMGEAFHYLFSQKGVWWLVLLTSMVCFYVGLLQSLLGPLILTISNSKSLGMTLSVSASGMLVSSLFIGISGLKRSKVYILSCSLALAGIFYTLMGVFPVIVLITLFGFLFFGMLPFVNTSLEVLIRSNINNEKQGRVWSLVSAISQIGYLAAFGSAGFLADKLFNPLLNGNGALVGNVGQIIGTGPGRGIGFLFILCGFLVAITAFIIGRVKTIRALEPRPSGNKVQSSTVDLAPSFSDAKSVVILNIN